MWRLIGMKEGKERGVGWEREEHNRCDVRGPKGLLKHRENRPPKTVKV